MGASKQSAKTTTNFRKIVSRAITIGCIVIFIYSAYTLISMFLDYRQNRQVLAEAQEIYYEYTVEDNEEEALKAGEIRPQFSNLQEINPDIVGWVSVEDTPINYPILQSTTNDEYLNHNYKGDYAAAGSIFMDYRVDSKTEERNMILYGHRMKDGSMFEGLTKFLDKDFFDAHKVVKFDTLYGSYDAEIFAVYQTTTDFDYIQTEFTSDEDYQLLLDEISTNSIYQTGIELNSDDQILTLSTCDYRLDPDRGRLVVHAKLIHKK